MKSTFDIHKSGGIIIKNRKLLVEKSKGKEFYIAPGGSLEKGEDSVTALIRELKEEFTLEVSTNDLEEFGTFYAKAAGQEDKTIRMDVYIVKKWKGEPIPDNEVEEMLWIDSRNEKKVKLGSIFENEVIPRLKEQNLID